MNTEAMIWSQYLAPGFSARPTTLADAAAATDVFNAASLKYTGKPHISLEQTLTFWHLPGFELARHSRVVVAPDGRVVANVDVDMTAAVPVRPLIWARVHPDYEGLGIGAAMLAWAEQCARTVFPHVPPDVRVSVLSVGIPQTAVAAHRFLESRGFCHTRDFWRMVIDLKEKPPTPAWPPGIVLSTMAQHPDLRPIVAAKEEAFRDHWGHIDQPLDHAEQKMRHWLESDSSHDPESWLLALDGDQIAGICLCRQGDHSDPDMGWVNILAVRRPYRGCGLGMALLQQSFNYFFQRGFKRAGLTVDASSLTGATRLYEKAGMSVQQHYMDFEKELRPGRTITTAHE